MRFVLWWMSVSGWVRWPVAAALLMAGMTVLVFARDLFWLGALLWVVGSILVTMHFRGPYASAEASELIRAWREIYAAGAHLSWWRRRPARALERIEPLLSLECPNRESEELYKTLMNMICAVTGDCYGYMSQPIEAAAWYRRAAEYRKSGGFALMYADLVLRHNLRDDYALALECMEHTLADKPKVGFVSQVLAHVVSGWWLHPGGWRHRFIERRLPARIRARMRESGVAEPGGIP